MGQNKLENDFRKKLARREIQPSADSWSRLEAMLDASDEKKANNKTWLYIAAGIAVLLFLATLLLSGEKSLKTTETSVADTETPEEVRDPASPVTPAPKQQLKAQDAVASSGQEAPEPAMPQIRKKLVKQDENTAIATQDKTPGIQSSNQTDLNQDQQIREMLPQPGPDEMLAAVAPQEKSKSKVKVDPKSLLSQVDGELELSFREKVIRSIGKNYQEVKVALANRNYE